MCAIHELGMVRLLSHPLLTYFLTNIQSAREGSKKSKQSKRNWLLIVLIDLDTHPKNRISCLNELGLIVPHMDSWIYEGEQIYHSNQHF